MGFISASAFFIVAVFGIGIKPWDAVLNLLSNQGVGEEEFNVLAYLFGYTLPLSVGFGIIAYLILTGKHRGHEWYNQLGVALAILWVCGSVSKLLGLGLSPKFSILNAYQGAPLLFLLTLVVNGYVHTYGWPLVICALALGIGAAIWSERKTYKTFNRSDERIYTGSRNQARTTQDPLNNPKAPIVETTTQNRDTIETLKKELISLSRLEPSTRGNDFENFLNKLFSFYELRLDGPLRISGEKIVGVLHIGGDLYIIEAFWRNDHIEQREISEFILEVERSGRDSGGVLISYGGFRENGWTAIARSRTKRLVLLDSQDIYHILNGEMSLLEAINRKLGRALETGEYLVSVFTLSHGG
jgi:hypothetical protein